MLFTARMKVTDRHSGFRCFFPKRYSISSSNSYFDGLFSQRITPKRIFTVLSFRQCLQKMCLKLPLKTRQAVAIKLLFDGRVIARTRGSGVFRTNECSDEFVSDLIASHSRIGVGGQLKSNWECGQDS